MIFYHSSYPFTEYTFSYLGCTIAENGMDNTIPRILFIFACTIAAASLIPFWIIMPTLFSDSKTTKNLSLGASICGFISAPFLSLIAIIPSDTNYNEHMLVTNKFFLLFAAAILIDSIAILLKEDY